MLDTAKDTTYNGWKNRATWNIVLWLMNEEPNYRACVRIASDRKARNRKLYPSEAEHFCREIFGDRTPDGDRLSKRVDWTNVAKSIMECAE